MNPLPQGDRLNALGGAGSKELYAAGEQATVLRFDGAAWTFVDVGLIVGLTGEPDLYAAWSRGAGKTCVAGTGGKMACRSGKTWVTVGTNVTKTLYGGWASGNTCEVVVGGGGTLLHKTGASGLMPVKTGTLSSFSAVWGSGCGDIHVVGAGGKAYQWKGKGWVSVSTGVSEDLNAVWGTSSKRAFAVGNKGTVLQWDGAAWTKVSASLIKGLSDDLYTVRGRGPKELWVGGAGGVLLRFDGTSWSKHTAPAQGGGTSKHGIRALWAGATGSYHAVGDRGVMHTNQGAGWQARSSDVTSEDLYGIWGSGPSDYFAVGAKETILRWDGKTWKVQKTGGQVPLKGVFGSGPKNVWAVGGDSASHKKGVLLNYNGSAWQSIALPSHAKCGTSYNLNDVWVSSKGDLFLGGYGVGCSIFAYKTAAAGWGSKEFSKSFSYTDVWGSGSKNVFAVSNHSVHRFDGTALKDLGKVLKYSYGTGIWGTGASSVFLVGGSSIHRKSEVFHWDSKAWNKQYYNSWTNWRPLDVWGSSDTDVHAPCTGGGYMHFGGSTWTRYPTGLEVDLNGVWGSGKSQVIMVGREGTIIRKK